MPEDDIYYEPQQAQVEQQAEPKQLNFYQKLIEVQHRLKAPKNQFNKYGGYAYRSCEDINEGLKPLLHEFGLFMYTFDEIVFIEGRFYLRATVTVIDATTGEKVEAVGYAREPENKKGSDQSQVTGSTSSYARKYALNALWLIDDTKDADAEPQKPKEPPIGQEFTAHCANCNTRYTFNDAGYYRQFVKSPGCCDNPRWEVE